MHVRVSGAEDGAGGSRQQTEAVKVKTPGPRGQQQNAIGGEVAQNFWISLYVIFGTESETARPKVYEPKHQRAAQGEHDEAGLNEIEEWQDEQVEADVAGVDGIGRPEILGPNQAQESIPFAGEHKTENCGRCSRPKNEKWGKPARVRLDRT